MEVAKQGVHDNQEITSLISRTLQEALDAITKDIDALKRAGVGGVEADAIAKILEETRQLTVFLKYAGDYIRRALPDGPLREEMLRIKLHLLSVLRSLVDAVRAQDAAVVHDLLTEELRDNLTLWKITILPLLRLNRPRSSGSDRT